VSAAALANAVLLVHAAFVLFVVGGLAAIWVGIARGARFAYDPWLRGAHLAAIAFVVAESILGYACPLTLWEDALRGAHRDEGFIARAVHAWMFWDLPPWVFTMLYAAFGLLVAWTWWRHPPRRRPRG
jgi:polyferredoxin